MSEKQSKNVPKIIFYLFNFCVREHDLRTMERQREMERAEAQIRISALELKVQKPTPGLNHREIDFKLKGRTVFFLSLLCCESS